MLNSTQLGCSQTGTSFSDIIINQCNSIADGLISGFGQFVHDPKFLNQTVKLFNQQKIPGRFADAVILRRIETQKLDDIWDFPLNMTCETTTPLPWTICEATRRGNGQGQHSYEYNIMRIIDFIGRNYVRLVLPEVDTSQIRDATVSTNPEKFLNDKQHMYLGSWHRDLIPRIISRVSFYPRQNAHKLFEYSGYDIYVYNILFGNAAKRMNDLMAGEDMFEICYDPYRTHGSALGAATYRGIDNTMQYGTTTLGSIVSFNSVANNSIGLDGFNDAWIHDTYMTGEQYANIYRKNVWYEAPIARNYHARHSIHSRRFIHSAKIIVFPLDILPFGYSIASSLPTAALAGDCGYISIDIYDNWFDRAFYLTKLSDIPVLFPVVNHQHYVPGDVCYPVTPRDNLSALEKNSVNGVTLPATRITAIMADGFKVSAGDSKDGTHLLVGWVNPNSIGKFGRLDYWKYLSGRNVSSASATDATIAEALSDSHRINSGSVVNGPDTTLLEGIIPTTIRPSADAGDSQAFSQSLNQMYTSGAAQNVSTFGAMGATGSSGYHLSPSSAAGAETTNYYKNVNMFESQPIISGNTSTTASSFGSSSTVDMLNPNLTMIYKPTDVSNVFYQTMSNLLQIKLLQVGYESLPSIRQFLSKLPNIYVTTEWSSDQQISMADNSPTFNINNDLYIQAILFWFIPVENNGMESLRLYPHHLINHEMPPIAGLRITNEQSQGTTTYDWNILNEITPHLLGLYNPLLENMGLLSFTPKLAANQLPLAYYDTNISGFLRINIEKDDSNQTQVPSIYNLKAGYLKVISIGVNGVASVNLSLYRLIF